MKYNNIILTIISILLALHLYVRLTDKREVNASTGIQRVNITHVGGNSVWRSIPVRGAK
jgi:hypothetical protein